MSFSDHSVNSIDGNRRILRRVVKAEFPYPIATVFLWPFIECIIWYCHVKGTICIFVDIFCVNIVYTFQFHAVILLGSKSSNKQCSHILQSAKNKLFMLQLFSLLVMMVFCYYMHFKETASFLNPVLNFWD